MKRLNIAYFGSSDFSAAFLKKLLTDASMYRYIEVKFVITQPDRPVGRKQILAPTPVKLIAQKYGLEILEIIPPKRDPAEGGKNSLKIKNLKLKIKNLDLCLLYAYAGIIPQELLVLPKYGFWCLHPSLLPKYRGTSPMATALINGDKTTGVTIFKMDEEIDHGPIIAQDTYTIKDTDYRPDLEKKLTDLGFEMFEKIIKNLQPTDYSLQPKEQDHTKATYTKKLSKQDGFIEFEKLKIKNLNLNKNLKLKINNLFRGLYPWPGIWTILPNGKRLKITELALTSNPYSLIPVRVQLEGKKEVDFPTFNKAYNIF